MKLVYFAWVRERVGKAEEELAPPASVKTVAELMRLLVDEHQVAWDPAWEITRRVFAARN